MAALFSCFFVVVVVFLQKMARRGANGSGGLLLEPIPSGVKDAGLRNFAFSNVSYTVPPGLLSRKKQGNIILDSIRQAGRIKSIHWAQCRMQLAIVA